MLQARVSGATGYRMDNRVSTCHGNFAVKTRVALGYQIHIQWLLAARSRA